MTPKTILVTCCGGDLVPYILKDLRNYYSNQGIKIIGVDVHMAHAAQPFLDKFYTVPFGSYPDYMKVILDIIKSENVDLLIPWSDDETITVLKNSHKFEELGCKIATPDEDAIKLSSNKEVTYQTLKDKGIGVPDFVVIKDYEDLKNKITNFSNKWTDFVLKPSIARGGRDVFVVDNSMEDGAVRKHNRQTYCNTKTFLNDFAPDITFKCNFLLMERLLEPAYDVDVLSWKGETLCIIPRRRHNPDGLPYEGYSLEHNQEIISLVRDTAQCLGISHLYDVDVMMGQDGTPRVMEINPRPSGSIAYSHFSEIPVMHYLIECHLTENWHMPDYHIPKQSIYPFNNLINA